jgi:hypothetical protein
MSLTRLFLVCSLIGLPTAFGLSAAASARAQDKPAAKEEDPHKRKLQKVRELMAGMNQREIAQKGLEIALEQIKSMGLPQEFSDKFKARFDVDELIESTVEIYAKHIEEPEIDAMIAFYKTESGKKVAQAMPTITIEAMKMGSEYGQRVAQEIAGGK